MKEVDVARSEPEDRERSEQRCADQGSNCPEIRWRTEHEHENRPGREHPREQGGSDDRNTHSGTETQQSDPQPDTGTFLTVHTYHFMTDQDRLQGLRATCSPKATLLCDPNSSAVPRDGARPIQCS